MTRDPNMKAREAELDAQQGTKRGRENPASLCPWWAIVDGLRTASREPAATGLVAAAKRR